MNEQLKKTFKTLVDRKVAVAYNTHQPVPHTNGFGVYLLAGLLKEVGTDGFVIQLPNKERLYGVLDDVYYFSDISLVKKDEENLSNLEATDLPPSVKAPARTDS